MNRLNNNHADNAAPASAAAEPLPEPPPVSKWVRHAIALRLAAEFIGNHIAMFADLLTTDADASGSLVEPVILNRTRKATTALDEELEALTDMVLRESFSDAAYDAALAEMLQNQPGDYHPLEGLGVILGLRKESDWEWENRSQQRAAAGG